MRYLIALTAAASLFGADVTFVRDVSPILTKVGCTSGPCHGGAKGKNGFKLSLRGYDPEFDYRAIINDMSGRRFNRTEPAQSLVLLKPTQAIPHGGGLRFDQQSPYYQIILKWLEEGAPFGDANASRVTKLDVTPAEVFVDKPGPTRQLKVVAHYGDGSLRDVTRDTVYSSTTPTIADVNDAGVITTVRKGEASALVRYQGNLAVIPVTALSGQPGFAWKQPVEYNYIDKLVDAKLERLHIAPSEEASDAEFLRRVSLDLIGLVPTPEQVRAFTADKTERHKKRAAMIDKLMAQPEFVNHWAVKWGDLLQVNRVKLGDKGMWAFRDWIRESLETNRPYDAMVRELITAHGSTYKNPPANFFRFTREPKVAMETTTQLFMGVRMVCAQCHDHPFEQWTQNQYYQLSAFFATLGIKEGTDSNEEIIYDKREGAEVKHPKDGHVVSAKFLFSEPDFHPTESDLRAQLADWLTSRENPFFAKAMANRMWSYFFSRGNIEPVDDIRATNPPVNAALLDAMTKDFTDHNFDLHYLIRVIVNSRVYQASSKTNAWNVDDETNFSHALPRRLTAEELFDSILIATGSRKEFKDLPRGSKAEDFPDTTIDRGGFLDLFGRPERQTSCECERRSDVSLVQALSLLNGGTIADAIADPEGRIATLIVKGATDRQIVEDLYLAALGRPPETRELDFAQTYMGRGSRAERAQDLMWALLNSNGFLFNQ